MGKLEPTERWRKHTLERFEAFKQSGELEELRSEGLAACGRMKRFTSIEWTKSPMRDRYSSSLYMTWYHKCETIAQKYGLAIETVVCSCLISEYDPQKEPFPIEGQWPKIRVITEITEPQFLTRLTYEAKLRGKYVIVKRGLIETIQPFPIPVPMQEPPPLPSPMPPKTNAFCMRVETPIGYPPEAATKLHKIANQLEKNILTALGYSVPKRLRSSPLVTMTDNLRIAEGQLTHNEAYDIIDEIYGPGDPMNEDQKRRKLVASRRHRLRQRLVKPYEVPDSEDN